MIKQTIQDAINAQITREMYSSNLYLSMVGYFQNLNLNGFAHWMRIQTQEENAHAMKFFDFLLERGGSLKLGKIDAPPTNWNSVLEAMEAALQHEEKVTKWINELSALAMKESDFATSILLQWFITEQVEEESNANDIIGRLKLIGDSKSGLFMLDSELKTRIYTPIATAGKA
jgi:ferritin